MLFNNQEDCLHDIALQKTSDVVEFGEDGGSDSDDESSNESDEDYCADGDDDDDAD